MRTRRVLITGGGGFVGSHLAEGLARLGHHVTALDIVFDAATARRLFNVERVTGALGSDQLKHLTTCFDLVIHAAAVTTGPEDLGQTPADHIRHNVDLLLDALAFAQRMGVADFVFVSSSGVFAAGDAKDVLLETTPPTGTSAYALAKRGGELIVGGAMSPSLATLTIRLGYIYGPHERSRPTRTSTSAVRRWLDQAERGEPIAVATPETQRDWTYAGDLAEALVAALELLPRPGVVHLGCGVAVSDLEVARTIAAISPGTRIDVRPAAGEPAVKAPMASSFALPVNWTSLADGIAATRATLVAA